MTELIEYFSASWILRLGHRLSMLGLVLCLNFFTAESQNLVGNPSFEEYSSCPTLSTNGIPKAIGWNGFSADYFHSCSQFSPLPLNNGNGYQCAATGNAIVGIYTRVPLVLTYREFVGAQLDSALILGQKYYVTVKVNLADNYNCATNRLGVLFTNDSLDYGQYGPILNYAHIFSSAIISDSINWTTIGGSFVADSGYQFINIGNFFATDSTDTISFDGNGCAAYYYIDDICVSTDSLTCTDSAMQLSVVNFGADTTTLNQGECTNFNVNTLVDYGLYEWEFDNGSTTITKTDTAKTANQCFCEAGTYDVTLIASDSATCGDTIVKLGYVVVNAGSISVDTVAVGICAGDSVLAGGSWQDTSGTYTDSLQTVAGCDSVIVTNLTVNQTYSINTPGETICNGDSVMIFGIYRTTVGTYYDSSLTLNGCDSIVETVLSVNPSPIFNQSASICQGDSILVAGYWMLVCITIRLPQAWDVTVWL